MKYCQSLVAFILLVVVVMSTAGIDRWTVGGGPSKQTMSGPERAGLALALSSDTTSFSLGASIPINLELRNGSGRLIIVQTPQVATSYSFIVVDLATGRLVRPRVPPRSGDDVYVHIPRGESYFLTVRLDDMVYLDQPGVYRVTVATKLLLNRETMRDLSLTSNSIVIHVNRN